MVSKSRKKGEARWSPRVRKQLSSSGQTHKNWGYSSSLAGDGNSYGGGGRGESWGGTIGGGKEGKGDVD